MQYPRPLSFPESRLQHLRPGSRSAQQSSGPLLFRVKPPWFLRCNKSIANPNGRRKADTAPWPTTFKKQNRTPLSSLEPGLSTTIAETLHLHKQIRSKKGDRTTIKKPTSHGRKREGEADNDWELIYNSYVWSYYILDSYKRVKKKSLISISYGRSYT